MGSRVARLDPSLPDAGLGEGGRGVKWLMARKARVPGTWFVPDARVDGEALESALGAPPPGRRYAVWPAEEAGEGMAVALFGVSLPDLPGALATAGRGGGGAVVQEMVDAVASGLAFSRNPMTGLDETVVEAVAGSPDRLASGEVVPARWVHRWGALAAAPQQAPLPEPEVAGIAGEARRLARAYGRPLALEWAWDGNAVWWLRLRCLVGLDQITVYSNRISKEFMPGIIKPLVWSVNTPMVNRAWIRLLTELVGRNDLQPDDLARAFAFRSYFNMSALGGVFRLLGLPADSLEVLLGLEGGADRPRLRPTAATLRRLPRILVAVVRMLGFGATVRRALPRLRADYAPFAADPPASRTDEQLAADAAALLEIGSRAAYLNVVTPLLANLYAGMLRRRLAAAGVDFTSFDLTAGLRGLEAYQPGRQLARLRASAASLGEATRADLAAGGWRRLPESLRPEFDRFLAAFGHLSDSGNDFSSVPWRENPDLLVALALAPGEQPGPTAGRLRWEEVRLRLGPLRRPLVRLLYRRARAFVLHREAVSSAYTYGYGRFRPLFLEMGRRLTQRGLLAEPADVMYLYRDELERALLGRGGEESPASLVSGRRGEIEALADVVMPEVIFGEDFVPARPAGGVRRLTGTPASRGRHTGPARVVRGIAEFHRLQPGDVLVIPYSDVSWTPLFARAGAVVAESGGMLSHSSIAAREYGLPCVVSVDGAMRLPDGATVTVDGYTGEVVVAEGGGSGGR